eukprot:306984_1
MKTYLMIISTIIVGLGQATPTDCSGKNACSSADPILDGAICSGKFSCNKVTITGDTICSGELSCISANITGTVNCSNRSTCAYAEIIGDVICSGENSCNPATITGGDIT